MRPTKINPVEFAIFGLVSSVFVHSVYNLFYDQQGFHPGTVVNLDLPSDPQRNVASDPAAPLQNIEVPCEDAPEVATTAGKIRLKGTACSPTPAAAKSGSSRNPASATPPVKFEQISIQNSANRFSATVFTDEGPGKYSTDYIPLEPGKNPITVKFTYAGGKTIQREFVVEKTQK